MSVDPPEDSEPLRRRLGIGIRFLSDARGVLMDAVGIRDRDGLPTLPPPGWGTRLRRRASRDIFLPTTFLLDEAGVIRWIYRPDTYRVRAAPSVLLRAIDALGRP